MWHSHDGMGWWMMFGGVMWLLLIGLLVFGVLATLRSTPPRAEGRESREDDPLEIARRRYARGEIDRDEFDQLRRDLSDDAQGGWHSQPT